MLTLIFNWLFRYAEDASFSDCVRAVLPAVLGERGGKGGREKCCVLCCVLCWDACVLCIVLCCVMRAVVLWPSTASYCLLHSFCTASAQLLHSFSAQHELTRSQPPNLPTSQPPNPAVLDRIDLSSASDRKELIKRATMTYVGSLLYGFYSNSVCVARLIYVFHHTET